MLLGVLTRHAVTIGIIYALVWEGVVGNFVPGARKFSIQQWAQSIADQLSSSAFFTTEIKLSFAVPALLIVTLGAVFWAGQAPARLLPHRRRVDPSRHVRPLSRGRTCSVRI